jgi:hypothetical protein
VSAPKSVKIRIAEEKRNFYAVMRELNDGVIRTQTSKNFWSLGLLLIF